MATLRTTVFRKLVGAGYVSARTLHGIDESSLDKLDIQADRHRVMMAAWLHSVEMDIYARDMVGVGCVSLRHLTKLSDQQLLDMGLSMGQRRRLQRHIRTDLAPLIERQAKARESNQRQSCRQRSTPARVETTSEHSPLVDERGTGSAIKGSVRPQSRPPWIDPEDENLKFANREGFDEPDKIMSSASVFGLSHPGQNAAHYAVHTPRHIQLKCSDGTCLLLS
mmetsp:Transcript_15525/g.35669  ORF Transcript_15525/g.35669 Transcript_15525/m.35669 type:complete len:223 (+) Transcript_15525:481-1149(+)